MHKIPGCREEEVPAGWGIFWAVWGRKRGWFYGSGVKISGEAGAEWGMGWTYRMS